MSRFVICYDLRKPNYTEADYEELYTELEALDAKHIQDSVWAVSVGLKAEQIFDALWTHMHQPKDRLLVADTGGYKNINGITRFKDA